MHLNEAHLLALGGQVVYHLTDRVADRAHGHHHMFGLGIAEVVEELILSAGEFRDPLHVLFHDGRECLVGRVDGFTVLEEGVVVLAGMTDRRVLRVQCAVTELLQLCPVHQFCHVVEIQDLDLLDLVAGAEAVEEVLHGDMSLDGGEVGHRAHIHAFLHAGRGQLRPAGLAACHHVGVIAEDGDRMRTDRAGGHMHHGRQLQAGNAVHRRDHQHQALRRGIGRRQRTGLQHALQCAAGSGLGLHLHDPDLRAEDVLHAVGCPLVHMGRHGAGRGDGVDRRGLRKCIGDIRSGLISVHGFEHFFL